MSSKNILSQKLKLKKKSSLKGKDNEKGKDEAEFKYICKNGKLIKKSITKEDQERMRKMMPKSHSSVITRPITNIFATSK